MLADLLALAGDTSDNYPGVKGIGAVGAAKLINEHGGVEQILERVNLLKPKLGEKLLAQADEARLFRRLAGLVDDLPLPVSIESAAW
jgi:DNA polymerase-1